MVFGEPSHFPTNCLCPVVHARSSTVSHSPPNLAAFPKVLLSPLRRLWLWRRSGTTPHGLRQPVVSVLGFQAPG